MKKIILTAFVAAAAILAVSCQPQIIKGGSPSAPVSEEALAAAFIIDGQYADAACTVPQTDGNYIAYHTSPAMNVQITYVKGEVESTLATGSSGVFYLYPKRKANPEQEFNIKTLNQDGTLTSAKGRATVFVPTKLKPEYELLLTDAGVQTWTWNDECVCGGKGWCYGEGGNTGAGTDFTALDFDGAWWGAQDNAHFEGYADVTEDGELKPDMCMEAYMTFNEDGICTTYAPDGSVVREGGYEIANYDPERSSEWEIGNINTTTPCTLCPYCIHESGVMETSFQLMYLDGTYMALCDPESSEAGDWDNVTYWMFKVKK